MRARKPNLGRGRFYDFPAARHPIEPFFHQFGPQPVPNNPHPNPTLHPLAETGPYYAVLLVAGTLDTKGGPCIDSRARVLDVRNRPIPGLYGAGNCVASPTGPAYWAGGATLGPAITFGALAAEHALRRAAAKPRHEAATGRLRRHPRQNTVALRVPDRPLALALLRAFDCGIAAPGPCATA